MYVCASLSLCVCVCVCLCVCVFVCVCVCVWVCVGYDLVESSKQGLVFTGTGYWGPERWSGAQPITRKLELAGDDSIVSLPTNAFIGNTAAVWSPALGNTMYGSFQ